jgi:predicted nucleic acid-binding protein
MIVVSDTTPLITLMKVGRLNILHSMFGEVCIPKAVFSEVTGNETFENEADIIRNSEYIKVVMVRDQRQVEFLQRATGLDLGESEAIIYADEIQADLLLMDEAAGRKVAQNMNLPITGSIGVLIKAFKSGIITADEADDAFARIKRANRHISEPLINKALEMIHGER